MSWSLRPGSTKVDKGEESGLVVEDVGQISRSLEKSGSREVTDGRCLFGGFQAHASTLRLVNRHAFCVNEVRSEELSRFE